MDAVSVDLARHEHGVALADSYELALERRTQDVLEGRDDATLREIFGDINDEALGYVMDAYGYGETRLLAQWIERRVDEQIKAELEGLADEN